MTQGKIERYHHTMKNTIKVQNYFLLLELERETDFFIAYYNHEQVHESLDKRQPVDMHYGRYRKIQKLRDIVNEQTLEQCRRKNTGLMPLRYHGNQAGNASGKCLLISTPKVPNTFDDV